MTDQQNQYPWNILTPPRGETKLSSVRVGILSNLPLYWTLDYKRRPGLLLLLDGPITTARRRPNLRELKIMESAPESRESFVSYTLLESTQLDSFKLFGDGLQSALSKLSVGESHYDVAINYAWQWFRFLRGMKDSFTPEAQRGLIAELLFLKDILSAEVGWRAAIGAWGGPFGMPFDFSWENQVVEVKSLLIGSVPKIKISNTDQLSVSRDELGRLVLVSFRKDAAVGKAVSVDDVVSAVRHEITFASPQSLDDFEDRIAASGYSPANGLERERWEASSVRHFVIAEGFPRIQSDSLLQGVEDVSYSIRLDSILPFEEDASGFVTKDSRS